MQNCILLPIEAESQDTALRIFSTLNDRGKPLSDADIFKAQFYKYYSDKGEKESFIEKWKALEVLCNSIFPSSSGSAFTTKEQNRVLNKLQQKLCVNFMKEMDINF